MKSNTGWEDNGNGTNSSAFAGLPGGYRNGNGDFYNVGANGYWWSSSENDTSYAWCRFMNNSYGNVFRNYNNKQNGFSVRCIKD